jgi:hypothetical protein
MFPLLRASPSFSHSPGHDQATDGRMRATAPPRDTASVFFHRSACWPSPSSRSMISKICRLSRPCEPRKHLERNRDSVLTSFAPGRPPPVHPRLTGACAAMRGFPDMCGRPRANAKAALGMARAPSFFTMSNSPLRGLVPRSTSLSRGAFLRPGSRFSFASHPRNEGWAERRQAHYFICRVCETRLIRASEARRVP